MEFMNFILMAAAAYLLLRKPEKERQAFMLLVAGILLTAFLFLVASRTSLLPGLNY